ncbi:uncharacterized protein [Aristolochia californica]|uniref:uncharacterized protein n=1 Tax=Aristolochia californica TaxID=171875 RepID=UPI0035DCB5A0
MRLFADFVGCWDLDEIALSGKTFTWSNDRQPPLMSKLDRFRINEHWLQLYSNATSKVLGRAVSDYWLIMVDTHFNSWGPPPFRFNNAWLNDVIQFFWMKIIVVGLSGWSLLEKLKLLKLLLRTWSLECQSFCSAKKPLSFPRVATLDSDEESKCLIPSEMAQRYALQGQLQAIAHNDLVHWKQHTLFKWLSKGDANTKFFHAVATTRRRATRITSLCINGDVTSDRSLISNTLVRFFVGLYIACQLVRPFFPSVNILVILVTVADLIELPFSNREIKKTAMVLPLDRASGLDGYNSEFYY